jgi:hypothetical protein
VRELLVLVKLTDSDEDVETVGIGVLVAHELEDTTEQDSALTPLVLSVTAPPNANIPPLDVTPALSVIET